jgi:hypothetical protein
VFGSDLSLGSGATDRNLQFPLYYCPTASGGTMDCGMNYGGWPPCRFGKPLWRLGCDQCT